MSHTLPTTLPTCRFAQIPPRSVTKVEEHHCSNHQRKSSHFKSELSWIVLKICSTICQGNSSLASVPLFQLNSLSCVGC
jgi:hypothetical protein